MTGADPAAAAGAAPGEAAPDETREGGRLRRLHPISPLLRGGVLAVAGLLALGRQLLTGDRDDVFGWRIELVAVGAVVVVAYFALSWWSTRYQLGEHTLRTETGVLLRRSRRIRLDRVQAVEVQQPLLARLTGMAAVHVETAGGGAEAELAYLTLSQAHALRSELMARAAAAAAPVADEPAAVQPGVPAAPVEPDQVVHRVPSDRLLVSQLVRTGPVLALGSGVVAAAASVWLGQPLGLALLVPVLLGAAGTVWSGFSAHQGFVLTRGARGLVVRAGLLDVRTQSVPPDRVQGVVVVEPLVWRWLGWCEVQVTVAGVQGRSDDGVRLTHTLVPVAPRQLGARVAAAALAGRDPDGVVLTRAPRRSRWLAPVTAGQLAAGRTDALVVTRRGWLTRRTDVVPRHKVQSCALRQGPLQRRLRLATLDVHLPAGPVGAEARYQPAGPLWAAALGLAAVRPPAADGVMHGTGRGGSDPGTPAVP